MPLYRRKSATLRAVELQRDPWNAAKKAKKEDLTEDQKILLQVRHEQSVGFKLDTANGPILAAVGDYIATRNEHDYHIIKAANFQELYEPADLEVTQASEKTAAEMAKELLDKHKSKEIPVNNN